MNDRLTPERLSELRRIAEAATPGPWWVDGWEVRTKDGDRFIASIAPAFQGASPDASCWEVDANARHIAEFDSPTVLAMVAEIERLRRIETATKRVRATHPYDHSRVAGLCDCSLCELNAALDGEKGGGGA